MDHDFITISYLENNGNWLMQRAIYQLTKEISENEREIDKIRRNEFVTSRRMKVAAGYFALIVLISDGFMNIKSP